MDAKSGIVRADGGTVIDRRLSGKDKSIGNRQRFMKRYEVKIRAAVKRALQGRNIKNIGDGEEIRIPKKDLGEPIFGHGQGGRRKGVHPGNKEYVAGDRIKRPDGADGKGGKASDSGEGEDDFIFTLTKEEFMKYFFDELELPNLARTTLVDTPEYKTVRAGYTTDGTPTNLHLVRSMRGALGRGIAFGKFEYQRELAALLDELISLESVWHMQPEGYDIAHDEIEKDIARLEEKLRAIPYLDPIDLRYRSHQRVPVPTAKAVMFCLMDVSGSMDEERKDLSKRFFILLYLFLTRHYEKIELVFLRHTTEAEEVDEETFFHATDNGGTMVSSALELMSKIIDARYANSAEWNIYGAQASDGDNWTSDSPDCVKALEENILPRTRYFAYIQVANSEQELWRHYKTITRPHFAMRKVLAPNEIYPVFRDLFKKEEKS